MRNQIILWALFAAPWFTLFFMKKEDIKRYLPVGLISSLASLLIVEACITLNIYLVKETAYPFRTMSYLLGLNPVVTMWIFKFTFRKFWLYLGVEVAANLVFSYLFLGYFMKKIGVFQLLSGSPFSAFLRTTGLGLVLYLFQLWMDGIFIKPGEKKA